MGFDSDFCNNSIFLYQLTGRFNRKGVYYSNIKVSSNDIIFMRGNYVDTLGRVECEPFLFEFVMGYEKFI